MQANKVPRFNEESNEVVGNDHSVYQASGYPKFFNNSVSHPGNISEAMQQPNSAVVSSMKRSRNGYVYGKGYQMKPSSSWNFSERVHGRTGYISQGLLMFRFSDTVDMTETRLFTPKDIDKFSDFCCSNTVLLNADQFSALSFHYEAVLDALFGSPPGVEVHFALTMGDNESGMSPTLTTKDHRVILRTWKINPEDGETRVTQGRVCLTKAEFLKFGNFRVAVGRVFAKYPHDLSTNSISNMIFDTVANTILGMMRGNLHESEFLHSGFSNIMMSSFLTAYTEFMNAAYSTNVIANVVDQMDQAGITTDMDLFSFFYQCMNQIPIIVKAIEKILA